MSLSVAPPRLWLAALLVTLAGCSDGGSNGGSDGGSGGGATTPATVTISGTVRAASGTVIDGDVNDPKAPFKPNDTPADAQPIPNPAIVGGYASAQGAGESGSRFESGSDLYDCYAVFLSAGQTVSLTLADFDPLAPWAVDLDLWLYTAADPFTPVADSLSNSETETLVAPASGHYHVMVEAWAGASNYSLSIGQSPLQATTLPQRLSSADDFISGELIIDMSTVDQPAPQTSLSIQRNIQRNQQRQARLAKLGLRLQAGDLSRAMLLSLGDVEQRQTTLSALAMPNAPNPQRLEHERPWGYGAKRDKIDTIRLLKALQAQADVRAAGLNYIRRSQALPSDPYYPLQWHYPLLNLPQAWDISRGAATIVAVIDTGVYRNHPDLAANLTTDGYDFIASSASSNDGDGIDSNPEDPGDGILAGQSSFHGTHVAGIIAAVANNAAGGVGVAASAQVMPIRVLGRGGATEYDIIQGIRYAAGLSNDSGTLPSTPAHIINLSLGGSGFNPVAQNSITAARAAGAIIIAAAGNDGSNAAIYPAAYAGVVSVNAVRYDKTLARYSNVGPTIDLSAPGGDMTADQNADGYPDGIFSTAADDRSGKPQPSMTFMSGTSMAAPHVAGVAALMHAIHPSLSASDFDHAILSGQISQDLGNDGASTRNNQYGYGLIDALKAVQYADMLAGGVPLPAIIRVDQTSLAFGASLSSLALAISNAGQAPLTISSVVADRSWLAVASASVDSHNLGTYRVTVDRTGLTAGQYRGNILVSSDSSTITIPVTLDVSGSLTTSADVGFQWILLIDAQSQETVDTLGVAAVAGRYSYDFVNIPPGDYYLISGSDSDNDFLICDAGESCGGYPLADQPQVLSLTNNRSGVDFDSSFGVGFSAQTGDGTATAGIRRSIRNKRLAD